MLHQKYLRRFTILFSCLSSGLMATTFTVTTTSDSGVGSLRQAILSSNAAGGSNTINFSILVPGTITLSSSLPPITNNVAITGPVTPQTVDGHSQYQIFSVLSGTVSISNITIQNAVAQGGAGGSGTSS